MSEARIKSPPKSKHRRSGPNKKATANAHAREWMVIKSTREDVAGVGDGAKQAYFGKNGAFTTSDAGFVRGLQDRFGSGPDSPVVIVPMDNMQRPRDGKAVFSVPGLPWKEED